MQLGTYSPKEIVLAINDYVLSDFSDGTFIELKKNKPYFKKVEGIRGKHTRVAQRDKSGELKFSLLQSSSQNDTLSKLALEDAYNQTGLLEVILKDSGGSTLIYLINAYIDGPPDKSYKASDTSSNEWTIQYEALGAYVVGGAGRGLLDLGSLSF